jgi:hypothetical protein
LFKYQQDSLVRIAWSDPKQKQQAKAINRIAWSDPKQKQQAKSKQAKQPGPDAVNCTIKLRLLAQPTAPVSTAISGVNNTNIYMLKKLLILYRNNDTYIKYERIHRIRRRSFNR